MIINAFEMAFEGCKRSLKTILSSDKFKMIRDKVAALSHLPADSDLAIAHRAGVLTMTELLNQAPERIALERAKVRPMQEADSVVDMKALIHLLGEALIEEAGNCLTEEMLEMADEWKGATAKRQLQITHNLLKDFQSEGQGEIDSSREASLKGLEDSWCRHLKSVYDDSADAVLPALYGKWNPVTNPANCQGKSQMVAAFAQKAGARCLCIHSTVSHGSLSNRYVNDIVDSIRKDMFDRDLMGADSGLDEGLYCSVQHRVIDNHRVFHVGCAIELSDGTWVALDAHGRSWGVFPKHWNVPSVNRLLNKYKEVIPGLIIQGDDGGVAQSVLEEVLVKAKVFIDRSRQSEKDLEEITSLVGLAEYIENSKDLDALSDFLNISEKGWLQEDGLRKILAMTMAVGIGESDIFDLPFKLMALEGDLEFLTKKKKSWLTSYHAAAHSHICRYLNRAEIIDPVIDFSTTEWSLAVAALNSCEYSSRPFGPRPWDVNELMIQLSADQTTLHNALRSYRRGELAQAAQQCLASFPVRHELCKGLL